MKPYMKPTIPIESASASSSTSGSTRDSSYFLSRAAMAFAPCAGPILPHFLAIALMYREDYSRAGYQMRPDFDADGHFTRAEIVLFALVLVIITMVPTLGRNISLIYPLAMAVIFLVLHRKAGNSSLSNLGQPGGARFCNLLTRGALGDDILPLLEGLAEFRSIP